MKPIKKSDKARKVNMNFKDKKIWYIHHNIAQMAAALDRLPDAAAIRKSKPRCAPLSLLEMVF